MHQPGAGVLGGLGALYTGIASNGGVNQPRSKMMIGSCAATSSATFIGVLLGRSHPLATVAAFFCAFGTAVFGASSQLASTLGVQATAVLVVFLGIGLPPDTALANASMVLFGAVGQLLLLTFVWPANQEEIQRNAVAVAIESLAAFARDNAGAQRSGPLIPGTQPFQDARAILDQDRSGSRNLALLILLVRRAESVRASLVGWARASDQFRSLSSEAELRVARQARVLERKLRAIAAQLKGPWIPAESRPGPLLHAVNRTDPKADYRHAVGTVDYLIRRLEETKTPEPIANATKIKPADASFGARLADLFAKVTRRPNVASLRVVSMQHALRYAVTLAAAVIASRMTGLWHAYWFPLTIALILRSDYAMTFTRGAARLMGTIAGVAVATILIDLFHPGPTIELGLMVIASWFGFALFQASYLAYSVFITLYVVFSISSSGVAPEQIGVTRMSATLLGVVVALSAYLLWPAVYWKQYWNVLRDAIRSQLHFAKALADRRDGTTIDEARIAARGLRIQCETLLRSAALDPLARRSLTLPEATNASERLYENAAEMLVVEAELSVPHPETEIALTAVTAAATALLQEVEDRLVSGA